MKREPLTPQHLYHRIEVCWSVIAEANERLRKMGSRPVNICATPSDVPPFTWLPKKRRAEIARRRLARIRSEIVR